MRLIVVREQDEAGGSSRMEMLRYALSVDSLSSVVSSGVCRFGCSAQEHGGASALTGWTSRQDCVWAVPEHWRQEMASCFGETISHTGTQPLDLSRLKHKEAHPWLVISNGGFATHVNGQLFAQVLAGIEADVVAVMAEPGLVAYQERVRLAQEGRLVGYRRLYRDSAEPVPMPTDWPHHVLIKTEHVDRVFPEGLPQSFGDLLQVVQAQGLTARAVAVAGAVVDLGTPDGLLSLSEMMSTCMSEMATASADASRDQVAGANGDTRVASDAQFIGSVLVGQGVCVESGAVVVGPSILCDRSTVKENAVVDSSILGAGAVLEASEVLRRSFVMTSEDTSPTERKEFALGAERISEWACPHRQSVFRTWSKLSYPRFFKRIADVIVAGIVLILFAPVIPVIAIAVKINSPGPVFFKDKRQGLHGKLFDCIKFRTMHVGAADIQDKLRFVSEVDGPQFKMADDPRISAVGRFLRETYLDEIPQFYNVLCGQMSIVGPRPSPEKENTLCPSWRDARLSVRPGITGFWQVCRTRRPFKDFQEWIFYDTKYVRELSPWVDIKMCWLTFKKMVENFIRQF